VNLLRWHLQPPGLRKGQHGRDEAEGDQERTPGYALHSRIHCTGMYSPTGATLDMQCMAISFTSQQLDGALRCTHVRLALDHAQFAAQKAWWPMVNNNSNLD
jgi:hypothetical protein